MEYLVLFNGVIFRNYFILWIVPQAYKREIKQPKRGSRKDTLKVKRFAFSTLGAVSVVGLMHSSNFNAWRAHLLSAFSPSFLTIQNLSSYCSTDMIMWNIPEAKKKAKIYLKNGKWFQRLSSHSPSLDLPLSFSLFLSLPLQPFSIISAQTSLLKRAKLKPQFSKLQNSIINAQLSLRLYWVQAWGETNILQLTHTHTHIYMLYRNTERSMQRRNRCRVHYYTQTRAHICHKSTTELHIMRKHANYTHTHTYTQGCRRNPAARSPSSPLRATACISQGCCIATGPKALATSTLCAEWQQTWHQMFVLFTI